jgi:hypothetical protein
VTAAGTVPKVEATHVVMRSFPGPGGRQFRRGEKVDARAWLTVEALEKQKVLARLGGSASDAHTERLCREEVRSRRRALTEALSSAQAELKHKAEAKRGEARAGAERALAEDLAKIAAELEAETAAARERLQKEHGLA